MDWYPLWNSLRIAAISTGIIFFAGIFAAYYIAKLPRLIKGVLDVVLTLPLVLPPTVVGYLLLRVLGPKRLIGAWVLETFGIRLVMTWWSAIFATAVVIFPLMYRTARGAFESLDPNMLDAARTLGWSNGRIFLRLMLPLAWSSIASGTVLAFARALGEFGCTLFLAGNQLGSTRTIPIAIYFEWMNGNTEATWFWTIVLLVFSFLVILFINLWSRHTTRYRQKSSHEGRSPKPRRNGTRGGGRRRSAKGLREDSAGSADVLGEGVA